MIRIAICDDNELQRELEAELLADYIVEKGRDISITSFSSGRELLEHVKKNGFFDIYLLDLVMPDVNGMEVASTLRMMKDNNIIVFLTATLEYAVASYDVKAFYYMLKPIERSRFLRIIDNAIDTIDTSQPMLVVKSKKGEVRFPSSDLMFVELVNRVPCYHLVDGRCLEGVMLRGSFSDEVAGILEDRRFSRCGVGLIINLKFVDAVDSDSILMRDGTQLFPPKSSYTTFRKEWKESRL